MTWGSSVFLIRFYRARWVAMREADSFRELNSAQTVEGREILPTGRRARQHDIGQFMVPIPFPLLPDFIHPHSVFCSHPFPPFRVRSSALSSSF